MHHYALWRRVRDPRQFAGGLIRRWTTFRLSYPLKPTMHFELSCAPHCSSLYTGHESSRRTVEWVAHLRTLITRTKVVNPSVMQSIGRYTISTIF